MIHHDNCCSLSCKSIFFFSRRSYSLQGIKK